MVMYLCAAEGYLLYATELYCYDWYCGATECYRVQLKDIVLCGNEEKDICPLVWHSVFSLFSVRLFVNSYAAWSLA